MCQRLCVFVCLSNEYYHHAKFDIYHIYSVRENHNVFPHNGHSANYPIGCITLIITSTHNFHVSHISIIWAQTETLMTANHFFFFLRGTIAHNDAPSYQVWLQNDSSEDIVWTSILYTLNQCCDLDLECTKPVFSHNTLAYDDVLPNQVWLPKDQWFRRYSRNSHILITWAFTVTLTLKILSQFFCMTYNLMTMHQNTKFGSRTLSGSGNIIWTKSRDRTNGCSNAILRLPF